MTITYKKKLPDVPLAVLPSLEDEPALLQLIANQGAGYNGMNQRVKRGWLWPMGSGPVNLSNVDEQAIVIFGADTPLRELSGRLGVRVRQEMVVLGSKHVAVTVDLTYPQAPPEQK